MRLKFIGGMIVFFILAGVFSAYATNGCFGIDPECGSLPTNNCDVTQNTTLAPGTHILSYGIDLCAPATLDCAGASIISGNSLQGNGITVWSDDAAILNCEVRNFAVQISILANRAIVKENTLSLGTSISTSTTSSYNQIINNNITQSGGIQIFSNHDIIKGNNITNLYSGIGVGHPFFPGSGDYTTIEDNLISTVQTTGISLGSSHNTVQRNVVEYSGFGGIMSTGFPTSNMNNTFLNNTIRFNGNIPNNAHYGISISNGGADYLIEGNFFQGNEQGIYITGIGPRLMVRNNTLIDHVIPPPAGGGSAIFVSASGSGFGNATIVDNVIYNPNAGGFGIYITGGNNITIHSNNITTPGSKLQNIVGISLYGPSSMMSVEKNTLMDTGGILLSGVSSGFVKDNTIGRAFGGSSYLNGVSLVSSSGISIEGNNIFIQNTTFSSNGAISFSSSNGNNATKNTMSNYSWGIILSSSNNNIFSDNDIINSLVSWSLGALFSSSANNLLYHNNFITTKNITISGTGKNDWNLSNLIGGNYYSLYDQPAEGCFNTNPMDSFCDSPKTHDVNNVDFHPFTTFSGWDNSPPFITSVPITKATFNQLYTYDVNAIDPDSDPILYSLLKSPVGMVIDPSTGLMEWFPNMTLAAFRYDNRTAGVGLSKVNVSVRASDPSGANAIQSFTITVGIGKKAG